MAIDAAGHCETCGTLLAQPGRDGSLLVDGLPVVAIVSRCPECGKAWSYPRLGLDIGTAAIEELAKTLTLINGNGGFGTLTVKFVRGKARYIGLESMREC